MKSILHIFTDYNAMKKKVRALSLPIMMHTDIDTFESVKVFDNQPISLDTQVIYFNYWVKTSIGLIIPDLAILPHSQTGFYLEQTEEMINYRDSVLQCSCCKRQYKGLITWCPECLGDPEILDEQLYRLFLRPVSTIDIDLTPKSVYIPKEIRDRHSVMPELTNNGRIINI